jgi:hypothetical protein
MEISSHFTLLTSSSCRGRSWSAVQCGKYSRRCIVCSMQCILRHDLKGVWPRHHLWQYGISGGQRNRGPAIKATFPPLVSLWVLSLPTDRHSKQKIQQTNTKAFYLPLQRWMLNTTGCIVISLLVCMCLFLKSGTSSKSNIRGPITHLFRFLHSPSHLRYLNLRLHNHDLPANTCNSVL